MQIKCCYNFLSVLFRDNREYDITSENRLNYVAMCFRSGLYMHELVHANTFHGYSNRLQHLFSVFFR